MGAKQSTINGGTIAPERRVCEFGCMCDEPAEYSGQMGRETVYICEECVEAHRLREGTAVRRITELVPADRWTEESRTTVENEPQEHVTDVSGDPVGWSR